jgi:hypothetical protein
MEPKSDKLKLMIELVPHTSWYNSLKRRMSKGDWDKIREKTFTEYEHRCVICGSEQRLNCHEIWEYDDKKHVQKLVGFISLCGMCYHVKHLGLAKILSLQGKLDYAEVVEHFMKINKCDRKTFEEHKKRAFDEWENRSKHKWQIDLGEYENLIQRSLKKGEDEKEK